MLIEHESHAYDVTKLWLYLDARLEFVASASWTEFRYSNTSFSGASCHKETVRVMSAECDNLDELRAWCVAQIAAGAERVGINQTRPIPDAEAPAGHRLHGKRDNSVLEVINASDIQQERKAA
jgi:hypothetical protein